ncbi:Ethe1, partial [Symbiodinium natans]
LVLRSLMGEADPWSFSYGYWYAFSMGILALGFGMGIYVPSLLPCAGMFFAIRYWVDRYNITSRAYGLGVESLGSFSRSVQRMLKMTVSVWWIGIGSGVLLYMHTFFENEWDSPVPRVVVKGLASSLTVLGVLIVPVVVICDAGKSAGLPMEVSGFDGPHSPKPPVWDRSLTTVFGELHLPGTTPRSRGSSQEGAIDSINSETFGYQHKALQPKDWDVRFFLKLRQADRDRDRRSSNL